MSSPDKPTSRSRHTSISRRSRSKGSKRHNSSTLGASVGKGRQDNGIKLMLPPSVLTSGTATNGTKSAPTSTPSTPIHYKNSASKPPISSFMPSSVRIATPVVPVYQSRFDDYVYSGRFSRKSKYTSLTHNNNIHKVEMKNDYGVKKMGRQEEKEEKEMQRIGTRTMYSEPGNVKVAHSIRRPFTHRRIATANTSKDIGIAPTAGRSRSRAFDESSHRRRTMNGIGSNNNLGYNFAATPRPTHNKYKSRKMVDKTGGKSKGIVIKDSTTDISKLENDAVGLRDYLLEDEGEIKQAQAQQVYMDAKREQLRNIDMSAYIPPPPPITARDNDHVFVGNEEPLWIGQFSGAPTGKPAQLKPQPRDKYDVSSCRADFKSVCIKIYESSSCDYSIKEKIFKALGNISKKLFYENGKYRTLNLNDEAIKQFLKYHGNRKFLKLLGYGEHSQTQRLVSPYDQPPISVLNDAINVCDQFIGKCEINNEAIKSFEPLSEARVNGQSLSVIEDDEKKEPATSNSKSRPSDDLDECVYKMLELVVDGNESAKSRRVIKDVLLEMRPEVATPKQLLAAIKRRLFMNKRTMDDKDGALGLAVYEVQRKLVMLLKEWIGNYWKFDFKQADVSADDDLVGDELANELQELVNRLEDTYQRDDISTYLDEQDIVKGKKLVDTLKLQLRKQLRQDEKDNVSNNKSGGARQPIKGLRLNIGKIKPRYIAEQWTLIDHKEFCKIHSRELLLQNYHSFTAICSGLDHFRIAKLDAWSNVSKKDKKLFNKQKLLLSLDGNQKNLRDKHNEARMHPPMVPFNGLLQKDVISTKVNSSMRKNSGISDLEGLIRLNDVITNSLRCQETKYNSVKEDKQFVRTLFNEFELNKKYSEKDIDTLVKQVRENDDRRNALTRLFSPRRNVNHSSSSAGTSSSRRSGRARVINNQFNHQRAPSSPQLGLEKKKQAGGDNYNQLKNGIGVGDSDIKQEMKQQILNDDEEEGALASKIVVLVNRIDEQWKIAGEHGELYENEGTLDKLIQDQKYQACMMQIKDWLDEIKRFSPKYHQQVMKQERIEKFYYAYNNKTTGNKWWSFV